MTKTKPPSKPTNPRWPLFTGDVPLRAIWPQHRYRFMFDDGRIVDVVSARDDSDLRAALLAHMNATAIVGVAVVNDEAPGT